MIELPTNNIKKNSVWRLVDGVRLDFNLIGMPNYNWFLKTDNCFFQARLQNGMEVINCFSDTGQQNPKIRDYPLFLLLVFRYHTIDTTLKCPS